MLPNLINSLREKLTTLFTEVDIPADDIQQGLDQIVFRIGELALQGARAASLGVPLAEAVRNADDFPLMHKVHLGLMDLLQGEIPRELAPLLGRIWELIPAAEAEDWRLNLARLACALPPDKPEGALARFCLYEGLILNVLIQTWRAGPGLVRVGIDELALDRIAEEQLNVLLDNAEDLEGSTPIRPMRVLLAATLTHLEDRWGEAVRAVGQLAERIQTSFEVRADLEELLRGMPADDAVLIRNYFARSREEQRLSVERVVKLHPFLFPPETNADSAGRRLRRRLRSLQDEGPAAAPMRQGVALIDVIVTSMEEE